MIDFEFDATQSVIIIRPQSRLQARDFDTLANAVDPQIEAAGSLAGIIIDAPTFPGWDDFAALIRHFRFVRDHQKHVKKIAVVTDSPDRGSRRTPGVTLHIGADQTFPPPRPRRVGPTVDCGHVMTRLSRNHGVPGDHVLRWGPHRRPPQVRRPPDGDAPWPVMTPGTRWERSGLLWLSRETGQQVLRADGTLVGLVADVSVELDQSSGPQMVQRLLVRRRRAPGLLVPWTAVVEFGRHGVLLNDGIGTAVPFGPDGAGLRDHEILLLRDVLDTQVVDIVGQRLARVSDVVLNRTADGRLELVGAEVGFGGGVLRRLGLHRLAVRAGDDVVDWTDLHLTSERGHTVQLNTPPRSAVHHLDESGLVALVDRLDVESLPRFWRRRNRLSQPG